MVDRSIAYVGAVSTKEEKLSIDVLPDPEYKVFWVVVLCRRTQGCSSFAGLEDIEEERELTVEDSGFPAVTVGVSFSLRSKASVGEMVDGVLPFRVHAR